MARSAPRLPLVLFGLLSVLTFIGPFLLWATLRGGLRADWPPDRPVEWWMFFGIVGGFAALMLACIGTATASLRALKEPPRPDTDLNLGPGAPAPTEESADRDLHL